MAQSSVLLPALSIDDVCEFYTYTTRVAVVDENQLPLVGQQFTITSASPCGVYIEDVYMLGAICFNLAQGDGLLVNVNPMLALRNAWCSDRWAESWQVIEREQRRQVVVQRQARRARHQPGNSLAVGAS